MLISFIFSFQYGREKNGGHRRKTSSTPHFLSSSILLKLYDENHQYYFYKFINYNKLHQQVCQKRGEIFILNDLGISSQCYAIL